MTIRIELLQPAICSQRDHMRGWIYQEIDIEPFIRCVDLRTIYLRYSDCLSLAALVRQAGLHEGIWQHTMTFGLKARK
ncbi:hypothetical protein ACVMB1_000321 [Bradyrhizobium sp. USDA 4504]